MENKSLERLIEEEPKIGYYINIIKERSNTVYEDLKTIEWLSKNHTAKQICDFLPKFISISDWSGNTNGISNEYIKKHEFINCGDFK